MSQTKHYSANEVTISIAGLIINSGFAEGEFCRIERAAPRVIKVVGADGEVAISKGLDRSGTVKIMLLSTSSSNDDISALAALNENADGFPAIGEMYIRDRSGRSLHQSPTIWVESDAVVTYGPGATAREWTFGFGSLSNFIGGNTVLG
jgi:hypothetical protein